MSNETPTHPFAVVDIPGKGIGILASRAIARGELILSERPIFTDTSARTDASVRREVRALSKADQRTFLSLYNCKPRGGKDTFLNIFETNALPLGREPGHRGGIFTLACRFNHSCSPNLSREWHHNTRDLRMYALRDIVAGEELCFAYFTVEEVPSAARQAYFRKGFGCTCTCPTCILPADELAQSDLRRVELDGIQAGVGRLIYSRQYHRALQLAIRGLHLQTTEGLWDNLFFGYHIAFEVCLAAQDAASAKIWGMREDEASVTVHGEDYKPREEVLANLKNPRGHPSWGWGNKTDLRSLTEAYVEGDGPSGSNEIAFGAT